MVEGFSLLDWLFAAGQGLFAASFFYFLYLVMRFSRIVPIISRSAAGAGSSVTSRRGLIINY